MKAIPIFLAGLLAAQPVLAEQTAPADHPRPVVSVLAQTRAELPSGYIGTVAARIVSDLGFPLAGTLAERPVEIGDVVARGDLIARLDPEELEADLRSAEAGVIVARAQLRSAQDAVERARKLLERGVGAKTRLEDAERALVAAQARMDQAIATRNRASDLLNLATLRAPQDGVVTAVLVEPGAAVSAGQPVVSLAGTGEREIVIDVTEQDAASIASDAEFVARLVVNPEIETVATLDRIDPVAAQTTRTRRVHLRLREPDPAFRLGALVQVSARARDEGRIILPRTAVLETADGAAVWVVDRSDDRVHLTPVTIAASGDDFVVIETGLAPGAEVVTKGIHSLKDGQIVGPSYRK
ncbi:RND family efflux transporter MFP subunit [Albidovulum inexpectatum]|uniref:RND family efflux transporter MFP subunit n=1 Tax=Albidovulum inexpectatum TaxID=196587 RepID=A0A2S5JLA3_9RHOB|nr:efflux RND transporter periplasmic adaptor subunit [Albidovulum inexpectatum]PPB82286.1 RND family efflux transporter MFP subunit [Albidovulum inexpectatum]